MSWTRLGRHGDSRPRCGLNSLLCGDCPAAYIDEKVLYIRRWLASAAAAAAVDVYNYQFCTMVRTDRDDTQNTRLDARITISRGCRIAFD